MPSFRVDPTGILVSDRLRPFRSSPVNMYPPKRIERIVELTNNKRPRICVVRGEGIGDVIMTTPAVHALKKKFGGNVDITYATNLIYLDGALPKTLLYNDDITNVIGRDALDESDYDTVISLHCPCLAHEKPMAQPINRIDLFARHMGFPTPLEEPIPRYFITAEEVEEAESFLNTPGVWSKDPIILVQLIGSSPTRSIDNQVVKNALNTLYDNYRVRSIILAHNSDTTPGFSYSDVHGSFVVRNKDIREIAALAVHCDLVLCPDSAVLHLAGALGVPSVSLFGPTDPRARINYYPQAVSIWGGEGLTGHPHWYEDCPHKGLCWRQITEEAIVEGCVTQLNSTKRVDINNLLRQVKVPLISTDIL